MMFPSNRVRVLVSTQPVDFRKGHDGLAAIVSSVLRKRAQVGREIRAELRDIEREAIAGGLLAKDWREMFEPKPDK